MSQHMEEHGSERGVPPLQRIRTGIEGFYHISMGGLIKGRATLIVGTSGSCKTLFALEVLYRSIVEYDRPGVFVTFEERPQDILRNVLSLNYQLQPLIERGKLTFIDASLDSTIVGESGSYDLTGLLAQLQAAVVEVGAGFVVLDSLGALYEQFDNEGMLRREIFRITDALRGMGVTALLTAERLQEYGPLSRLGIEEFVSDCVIVLRQSLDEERVRRTIQIYKMRGAAHQMGEFPFTIGDSGIVILPLSAIELGQESGTERIGSGNADLDRMAGGGLFRDSITLVSGPTGAGKTLLCTTFASEACRQGERVLYLGYEESRQQLMRNAQSWGMDFHGWEQEGLLRIFCQYPEVQGIEGHFISIRREIERFRPTRLVVDSVSALERTSALRGFREFLVALTGLAKEYQICSLFTCTTPKISGGESVTESHISTITDTIILLRYVEIDASLYRGILIIKMRGSQHDKEIREFSIDSSGLHIGKPFKNVPHILQGIPSADLPLERPEGHNGTEG
jgi:circadian clock protein KaiC